MRYLHVLASLIGIVIGGSLLGCAVAPSSAETVRAEQVPGSADSFGLILAAADHEALYTLAGGLKPMSSGIWTGSFDVGSPDLKEMRSVRAALEPLRNEIWYADVQVFDHVHDGERSMQAYVIHRAAFARVIDRFDAFWSRWGITPETHPPEVIAVVDRMPRADRWRGYGYLYGYPAGAVDFFVRAGLEADDGREVGPGKDRRFVQIPTYAAETGRFTYAVPLDHTLTEEDDALADKAGRVLRAYSARKAEMGSTARIIGELRRLNRRFDSSVTRERRTGELARVGMGDTDAVLDAR